MEWKTRPNEAGGFFLVKDGDYIQTVAPKGYSGRKYHHGLALEHHVVWWKHHGVSPRSDEVIHHVNRNKQDNRIENLMLMTRSEHAALHGAEKERTISEIPCNVCGGLFKIETRFAKYKQKTGKYLTCSKKCSASLSHKKIPKLHHNL